jgi:hypothetical protein
MGDLLIIPSPRNAEGYVPLSRSRQGRLFKKHILNLGQLQYEGQTFNLDDSWYAKLKHNFNAGVADIVQVPLADAQNRHSEDPSRNLGEVVDVERDGQKVYAIIDARQDADKFGTTYLGSSAFLHMNYKDTATQERVGPALLHVCVTNRPYITGLEDYQEVIAATADETEDIIVRGGQETVAMTKEELLEQLKAEHGIDVEALEQQATAKADTAQLTSAIMDALKDTGAGVKLSDGQLEAGDVVGAIVELAGKNEALTEQVVKLTRKQAEREVDGYIGVGRLLPKSRTRAVEEILMGRGIEDFLAPEKEPYVKLNSQVGQAPPDGEQKQHENVDEEIVRLTQQHSAMFSKDHNGGQK